MCSGFAEAVGKGFAEAVGKGFAEAAAGVLRSTSGEALPKVDSPEGQRQLMAKFSGQGCQV